MKALLVFFLLLSSTEDPLKNWADGPEGIILSQTEKRAWHRLGTDQERQNFISRFWAGRDPIASTPANEYREDFDTRVADANRLFGGEGASEGWRTERGRFYILLGPPGSRAHFKGYGQLRQIELWMYTAAREYPQLPPFFNLLFYQRDEVGSYRRYSPFIDQPRSLLKDGTRGNDHAWRTLYDVNPELAHASLSLIPSEPVDTQTFSPSMASDAILAQINQIPKMESERVARLNELVDVTLRYQTNLAEMDLFRVMTNPDTFMVDFNIQRPPSLGRVKMETVLRREEKEIARTVANFEAGAPLIGRLILKAGTYNVETTISDPGGTETLVASKSFDLTAPAEPLSMSEVLVFEGAPAAAGDKPIPFAHAGYKFTPRTRKQLHPSERLDVLFQLVRRERKAENMEQTIAIDYTIANINNGTERRTYRDEVAMSRFDSNGSLLNSKSLSVSELHPGRYFLIVTATDPAGYRASQTLSFVVTGLDMETSSRQ